MARNKSEQPSKIGYRRDPNKKWDKDDIVNKAIEETALEFDRNPEAIKAVFTHFIKWNRTSMGDLDHVEYYWPAWGTFKYFGDRNDNKVEHYNSRKLKDSNRILPEPTEEDVNSKEKVIQQITEFHPKSNPVKYKQFAWYIGGGVDEGDWNIKTMYLSDINDLNDCLELLKKQENDL